MWAGFTFIWHASLFKWVIDLTRTSSNPPVLLLPVFSPHRYSIDPESDPEALFRITTDNGLITTAMELDREQDQWHNITVIATQRGNRTSPPLLLKEHGCPAISHGQWRVIVPQRSYYLRPGRGHESSRMTRTNRDGRERDNGVKTQIAFGAQSPAQFSFRDGPPEV